MVVWNDWRLLREQLQAKGILDTDLTDEPLDEDLASATAEFVNGSVDAPDTAGWEDERIAVAALQLVAKGAGVEVGDIDGLPGPQTRHALEVMEYRLANAGAIDKEVEEVSITNPDTARIVIDAQMRDKEPASIRYSNPGAMYPGPSATKFGSTRYEVIGGGHLIAVFDSDEQGAAAQFDLLDRKYTGMTMRAAIAKWCGGNSAAAYAQRVSKETGVKPEDVLTHDVIRNETFAIPLARAMAQVEAGKPFPMDDDGWQRAHALAFADAATSDGALPSKPIVVPAADPPKADPIPKPVPASKKPADIIEKTIWPRQSGVPAFFGAVGTHQVKLQLPYPMFLAWQTSVVINSISLHEKVAPSAGRVFQRALDHYGIDEIKRLRLNSFGGSLNVRKMTGGSAWSMHAWGIAIDIDPDRNQFAWHSDKAMMMRPEYAAFVDMWYAEGWINLGREIDHDAMHFQAARL